MTVTMWLTLVAAVGMAILIVTVVRARHALAAPLGVLIADMLVWNLAWLANQLSDNPRWHWLGQCAASLVAVLGLDFVLTFVGRRRELSVVRRGAYVFFAATTASTASRFIVSGDELYVGDAIWWRAVAVGGTVISALVAWLLIGHYRSHRNAAERAHTRLLMIGFGLWTVLAATDLLHRRVSLVPQMSAVGMLLCVAVMTIVMDRVRPHGPSRWWALYTALLFVIALSGNLLVFKALPAPTAMLFARTVILVAVGIAAAREIAVMMTRRRRRMADLALVGRVTAQMAHDLQNPLAAIKCAAQVIEEDRLRGRGTADGLRQERMLAVIFAQAERLSAIVDDNRRVGRIEPRAEPVEIDRVMDRIGRPPHLAVHTDLLGVPRCLIDPELIARAIDNLVQNAAEAMPGGGTIRVFATTVDQDGAAWVELSVSDDGPGMDARTCERAFDDFFTTKAEGSGLGLAFVRRVAEAHGGDARIVSHVGRGTCVCLRLPCARPLRQSAPTHVHAAA